MGLEHMVDLFASMPDIVTLTPEQAPPASNIDESCSGREVHRERGGMRHDVVRLEKFCAKNPCVRNISGQLNSIVRFPAGAHAPLFYHRLVFKGK